MVRDDMPALQPALQPTIVMKDHVFDRDLDDLGMSPEDLEREVEPATPAAPERQESVLLRH